MIAIMIGTNERYQRPTLTMGQRIRLLRGLHGWSQNELALFIQTTQRTIAKLEGDTFRLSTSGLSRCTQLFSVTDHWLMRGVLPVFDRSAVLLVLSDFRSPGRRIMTIQQILTDHLATFFNDAEIREAWSPHTDLFVFRSQDTWVFLDAGTFKEVVELAADRADVTMQVLPPIERGLSVASHGFPKVFQVLAPHLGIDASRFDVFMDTVRGQMLKREAVQREAAGPLREKICALIAASGLSREEVLAPLLHSAEGGTTEPS